MNRGLTTVPGVEVGHVTDAEALTGCTAILVRGGAVGAVSIVGGATGTRNLDPLLPGHGSDRVHGICLAGGSNFGLAAVDGVLGYLRDEGVGVEYGGHRIPLVPGAILFDLASGEGTAHPDAAMGEAAARAAGSGPVEEGRVGAGTGATVGNLGQSMPGGIGSAGDVLPDGLAVGALAAVNCFGDVRDPETNEMVAGALRPDGSWMDTAAVIRARGLPLRPPPSQPEGNTTLCVVATNARLSREELGVVTRICAGALHRCISPVATNVDGDVVFGLSAGEQSAEPHRVALIAKELLERSIVRAVTEGRRITRMI